MEAQRTRTASSKNVLTVTLPSDREVLMTRTFDAPRRLVFEAWTTPEHVARWFGPRGWTAPVCQIDLRPGGAWRYILRGPDGSEMGMKGVYQEVVPHERLVYTESFDEFEESGAALVTMTLEEHDGRTTMRSLVLSPSPEARDAVIASGMEEGAGETLDRLEEQLATMA